MPIAAEAGPDDRVSRVFVADPGPDDRVSRVFVAEAGPDDCVSRVFVADPTAVIAAVQSLAGPLDLTLDDEAHWQIELPDAPVRGTVTIRPDGLATSVLVRIEPSAALGAPLTLGELAGEAAVLTAPLLAVLIFMSAAGLTSVRVPFLAGLAVALACPLLVLVSELRAAWREHAVRRRTRDWHARFWPALATRVVVRRPYR